MNGESNARSMFRCASDNTSSSTCRAHNLVTQEESFGRLILHQYHASSGTAGTGVSVALPLSRAVESFPPNEAAVSGGPGTLPEKKQVFALAGTPMSGMSGALPLDQATASPSQMVRPLLECQVRFPRMKQYMVSFY